MEPKRPPWETRYARKLLWTDIAAVVFALFLPQLIDDIASATPGVTTAEIVATLLWRSIYLVAFAGIWLVALSANDSRSPAIFGSGPEEYKRVSVATIFSFGLLSIIVLLTSSELPKRLPYLMTFVVGLLLILIGRWVWRKRLHYQRRQHRHTYRTLIIGEEDHVAQTLRQLRVNTLAGFAVVGVVTDTGKKLKTLTDVKQLGDYDGLLDTINEHKINALIVTGSSELTPGRVRRIGWELEDLGVDMIVAANLTDISGPRLHVRPVSGLPLIHMEYPKFVGWRYYVKQTTDLVGSLTLIVLTSPILLWLAIAVKRDSPGRIIFKQERLGLNGKPFTMFKFRTMREGAEDELPSLLDRSEVDQVLFKVKADPRVTEVGRFMRKHSLDELPQLFNVLRGEMSLVGPRPPLPDEVEQYDRWEHRRLLVRPGMSGLWQVSGRSDLSWEESVRLDLLYVENWSFTGDLLILWRTIRAVVKPKGAY